MTNTEDKKNKYVLDENGEINWKALIPAKFLYINNDLKRREKIEKKYGKSYEELDPIKDNIADSDLICMLGGLKFLLKKRGYRSVNYWIKESSRDYASVNCSIVFKGNPDIPGEEEDIEYSDNACAHTDNTTNFAKLYLLEMATNRALARCIRSFLNINVVSKEELSENSNYIEENNNNSGSNPQYEVLKNLLNNKNITFEQLKKKLEKDKGDGKYTELNLEKANKIEDLPLDIVFDLIGRIKAIKK